MRSQLPLGVWFIEERVPSVCPNKLQRRQAIQSSFSGHDDARVRLAVNCAEVEAS